MSSPWTHRHFGRRALRRDAPPASQIAGPALPAWLSQRIWRSSATGRGVFKVDYALEPVPWTTDACRRAGTVHLGGTLEEIATPKRLSLRARTREALRARRASRASSTRPARPPASTRLGLLPRPQRLHGRHDRAHRGPDRALRARLPRPRARAPHVHDPQLVRGATTRTTSAATSPAAHTTACSCSSGPCAGLAPTARRTRGCSSARPRRRPAAACTACAAITPRRPPSTVSNLSNLISQTSSSTALAVLQPETAAGVRADIGCDV